MMINDNLNFNLNVKNLVNKIMNINEELNSKNNIKEKIKSKANNIEIIKKKDNENKSQFINNNKESIIVKMNTNIKEENIQKKCIKFNNIEIENIKQTNKIFNMIILLTGNIATSSIGIVTIYDSNKLLSPFEKDYLLQKINISKDKEIGYVFEFPDKTLLCSTYGKIFRLKLTNNDRKYNILGIIELEETEIPSKLISFGNSILSVLTIINKHSFIRLFIKSKDCSYKNNLIKNYYINDTLKLIDDYKNYNYDNQNKVILNDHFDYLDKKQIEKDKEFYAFSENNNINLDNSLLCSID